MSDLVVAGPPPSPLLLYGFGLIFLVAGVLVLVYQKAAMRLFGRNWSLSLFGDQLNPSVLRFFTLLVGCVWILIGLLITFAAIFHN